MKSPPFLNLPVDVDSTATVNILQYAPKDVAIEIMKKFPPKDLYVLSKVNKNINNLCKLAKNNYQRIWSEEIILELENSVWNNNCEVFKFWYKDVWDPTKSLTHPEYLPGEILKSSSRKPDLCIFKILINNPNITPDILFNIFVISLGHSRFEVCDIILNKIDDDEKYEFLENGVVKSRLNEKNLMYILDNTEFKYIGEEFKQLLLQEIVPYQRFDGYVKLIINDPNIILTTTLLNNALYNQDILEVLLKDKRVTHQMKVNLLEKSIEMCLGGEEDTVDILMRYIDFNSTQIKTIIIETLLKFYAIDSYSLKELEKDNTNPLFTATFEEDCERSCISILFGEGEKSKIDFTNFDWSNFAYYMESEE